MILAAVGHRAVMTLIRLYQTITYAVATIFVGVVESKMADFYRQAGVKVVKSKKEMKGSDIAILDKRYYPSVVAYKSLGTADTYLNGYWECEDLEEHFYKLLLSKGYRTLLKPHDIFINYLQFQLFNLQTAPRSWEVGKKHYDLGNDLFVAMLDKNMNYSCGYWKDAKDVDQAQINKMELIAQKLKLKPGMKVLDIGCGWGSLAKYLAEKHQVKVVGLTISKEQAKLAVERCEGLPVEIRLQDYRDLNETFDRIVSVGMFEHVGKSNYRTYFEVANKSLKDDGIFLLHTIGVSHPFMPLTTGFYNTYIFPNGIMPYYKSVANEIEGLFIIEDWQNMGYHYCLTLRAWLANFKEHWPTLKKNFQDPERFYRMWTLYLTTAAASFRSRKTQLWQIVLSKDGVAGGYESPR